MTLCSERNRGLRNTALGNCARRNTALRNRGRRNTALRNRGQRWCLFSFLYHDAYFLFDCLLKLKKSRISHLAFRLWYHTNIDSEYVAFLRDSTSQYNIFQGLIVFSKSFYFPSLEKSLKNCFQFESDSWKFLKK